MTPLSTMTLPLDGLANRDGPRLDRLVRLYDVNKRALLAGLNRLGRNHRRALRVSSVITTFTNWPGQSWRFRLSKMPFSRMVPVVGIDRVVDDRESSSHRLGSAFQA